MASFLALHTIIVIFLSALTGCQGKDKIVACYYTNWSQYREGVGRFIPSDIDASLCTHLFFAFTKIDVSANTITSIEWNYHSVLHPAFMRLRSQNRGLKLIMSVGGYTAPTESWVSATHESNVTQFCKNVVAYVRKNQFDGVDIDWETPDANTTGGYLRLVKGIRDAIEKELLAAGQEKLIFITDVKANINELPFYSPAQLAGIMDYIILMAYDFYGYWSPTLGHHSPLFLSKAEPPGSYFSQHKGVEMWLEAGIPAEKLILGMAAYGRSLVMSSLALHKPGDNFTGQAADMAPHTKEDGFYAYYEVCKQRNAKGWKDAFMEASRVPYSYGRRGKQLVWIGYDNPASIAEKTVYAVSRGLAGVMLWSLDFDDFRGTQCGSVYTYPLLRSMSDVIKKTPRCKTTADCAKGEMHGGCINGFCACPQGAFISTKRFCNQTTRPVVPSTPRGTACVTTSVWLTVLLMASLCSWCLH